MDDEYLDNELNSEDELADYEQELEQLDLPDEEEEEELEVEDKWYIDNLTSSVLNKASYNFYYKELRIVFNTGRVYAYYNVEPEKFEYITNAISPGSYFYNNIRLSYQFSRLR